MLLRTLGSSTANHLFALLIFTALALTITVENPAAGTVLLGNQNVEAVLDKDVSGKAEAFQTTATASGSLGSFTVYLDASSNATQLIVGLYTDSGGHPGTLLLQGSSATLSAGGWNTVPMPQFSITSGTKYWIAILGTGGTLAFRDGSGCLSENSAQINLTTLPATWSSGPTWHSCPLSAYGTAALTTPVLSVSSTSFYFTAVQNGSNPPPATLDVSNSGGGTLNFAASTDASWLSVSPTGGSVSGGAPPQPLQVSATVAGLAANTYTGHVTITAPGAQGSPVTIKVSFTVTPPPPPPTLSVSPSSLPFTAVQNGANPSPSTVNVSNTGGGALSFTTSTDASWLTVSPTSGTANGGGAAQGLQVSASISSLAANTYTGHITVASAGVQGSPATVTVTLTVTPAPAPSTVLIGDQSIEGTTDSDAAGSTEAFQATAIATGTVGSFSIYLDSASAATQVFVGVYTNTTSGHPGSLLGQGSSTTPKAGVWNTVPVSPVNVTSGTTYWIAILGTGGTLKFRDGAGCISESNAQRSLTTLPTNWTSGSGWPSCPLSAYGSAAPPPPGGGTFAISGTISPASGGAGTTVALSGAAGAVTTADSTGNFNFSGLTNGTYAVTPSKPGYAFNPTSQNVPLNGGNVPGVNFTATPTFSISGTITGASGATLALSGAASATTTADSSGNYSFGGLANGTYTISPGKAGFTFTPSSQTVTINSASVTGINFTAVTTSVNLTVDGSKSFQTMNGTGVNINVNSWNGGQLTPALDLLINTDGATVFRVARDPMNWVSSESLIPALHNLDPTTLQQVYEAPKMQDIWNTISYLNLKGFGGSQIILTFMGWTPTWLGGSGAYGVSSHITAGKEPEFATMVASLVYYARKVKNLNFTFLSPLNESDWNCLEGPCVGATQYVTVLDSLITELNFMGLSDVRLVGPDTASSTQAATYISGMMADATIAGRVDHLTFHAYGHSTTPGTPYPPRSYWLTETAAICSTCDSGGSPSQGEWAFASQTGDFILGDLENAFPSVLAWEGYDSFWYHHNIITTTGLLAYDPATGVYTPRPRFYVNAQINAFISPGAARISESDSISALGPTVALYNSITGKITILGHNTGSSSITINGQLLNLPAVVSFAIYETNSTVNLQRGADVPVTNGLFSVTIPPDTFFSLAN